MSTVHRLPADSVPGSAALVTFVNGSPDRYRALCLALAMVLQGVKMDRENLQDVLSDLSDILDGLVPSPRSGFVPKK